MIVLALCLAALILAVVVLVQGRLQPLIAWAVGLLAIALLLMVGCGPTPNPFTPPLPAGPDGPNLPDLPAGEPAGDQVLVAGDSSAPDSLSVPRLVLLAPSGEASASLRLVAGSAPRSFEIVVAQADTTAAVLRAQSVHYTRNRGLQGADPMGQVLAGAQVVVVSTFDFQSPGPALPWDLSIHGRSPGRSLIHVFWQAANGEALGKATIEVRVG